MTQTQRIKRHGGYWICRDPEDGYYWRNGKDGGGYFDDIADCRASIDDYNAERLEIDRMEGRLTMGQPYASNATLERLIVGKAVDWLLSFRHSLSVETGNQEPLLALSDDADAIIAAALASPEDEAWIFTKDHAHFVKLVLGNGVDVISDYSIELERALTAANDLAKALEA